MNETRDLLERVGDRFEFPADAFERLEHRRERKRKNRRIAAGVVGIAVFAALVFGLARATLSDSGPSPADRPTPTPSIESTGSVLGRNEIVAFDQGQIEAVDQATGDRRTLVTCGDPCIFFSQAAVSADRHWLAYTVETCLGALPCEPEAGLWVANGLGERRQLVQTCEPGHCFPMLWAWSPTSDTLAVAGPIDAPSGHRSIFLIDPSTGARTEVADAFPGEVALAWSPDGSRLAYDGDGSVHIVGLGGGSPTVTVEGWSPVWSPEGTRLAVMVVPEIFVTNADGSHLHRVANGYEAVWSPDGSKILTHVEEGRRTGRYYEELWVATADGSDAINILPVGCCSGGIVDDTLRWSPDGTRVAFLDARTERWRVLEADGEGDLSFIEEIEVAGWPSR
jgi:WD40-like Beta Propeller Repeat